MYLCGISVGMGIEIRKYKDYVKVVVIKDTGIRGYATVNYKRLCSEMTKGLRKESRDQGI